MGGFSVVGEIVLRIAGYPRVAGMRWIADDELQELPAPHQDAIRGNEPADVARGRAPIRVRINEHSLRCADVPLAKPAGEKRVLVVGDSLTFGAGVDEAETFPAALECALRARDGGADSRVINAGVNGWSTWHYRTWIERRGLAFAPDVLVVGLFFGNDMEPPPLRRNFGSAALENALRRTAVFDFLLDLHRDYVWKHLRAWHHGTTVEAVDAELAAYAGVEESKRTPEEQWALWTKFAAPDLAALGELARAKSLPLLVVSIPTSAICVRPSSSQLYEKLLGELRARSLDVVDLAPILRPHGASAWLAWDQGHLNADGCRVVGEALAKELASRGRSARSPLKKSLLRLRANSRSVVELGRSCSAT
ncbi:MAG: hypothetical protein K8S98_15685 [Planctomycetes bacterium]|nr:hypothetical protein [Planctomycetota bacterium]